MDIHKINNNEICDEYGAIFDCNRKSLIRFTHFPISKEYKIPEGIQIIGNEAFCRNLVIERIILPQSLMFIGEKAFYNCPNLKEIVIEGIPSQKKGGLIGEKAFALCASLKSVQILEGFEYIGAYAFIGCINLYSIILPQSIIHIGEFCFANTKLNSIELPINLLLIGSGCFKGCSNLNRIISKSPQYLVSKNELLQIPSKNQIYEEITLNSFIPNDNSLFYSIYNKVDIIGASAFSSCQLEAIIIPEGVVSIGNKAFWGCNYLRFIQLPSTIMFIADDAFLGEYHSGSIYSKNFESWIDTLSSIEGIKVPLNYSEKIKTMLPNLSDKIFECNESVSTIEEFNSIKNKYLQDPNIISIERESYNTNFTNLIDDNPTYNFYNGSYVQDVMEYSDDDIDTIFDGDSNAYWNID